MMSSRDPSLWSPPCAGRIIIVCALRCEASPLIDAYNLRPAQLQGWKQAFVGDEGISLIVSGPGALAAATAVGFARGALLNPKCAPPALSNALGDAPSTCYPGFINIGVAGHSHKRRGELFSVNKVLGPPSPGPAISDPEYPVWTRKQSIPSDVLQSVDLPQQDYHHPSIPSLGYDMEGYAFVRAAKHFADAEDIALYKIVLDGPQDPLPSRPAKIISALISAQIDHLREEIEYRKQHAARRCDRQAPPPVLFQIKPRLQPSVSQHHRLHTLILRYRALCPDTPLPDHVLERRNAADCIHALEAELLALHDPYGTLDALDDESSDPNRPNSKPDSKPDPKLSPNLR